MNEKKMKYKFLQEKFYHDIDNEILSAGNALYAGLDDTLRLFFESVIPAEAINSKILEKIDAYEDRLKKEIRSLTEHYLNQTEAYQICEEVQNE